MFEGVEAIYFDLDDTLCGYWDACKLGLRKAFAKHETENYPASDLLSHWAVSFQEFCPNLREHGFYEPYLKRGEVTRLEQMRRMLSRIGIEDEALAQSLSDHYLQFRHEHLKLFPESLDVLNRLKGNYPLGLITNGPADIQRLEIEVLGIGHYFDNVFIEGELGFGKPEPEVFRRAAEAVDKKPEQLLFVGNSYRHDIKPAIAAGWKSAWVRRLSDVPPSEADDAKPEERPPDGPAPTLEMDSLLPLLDYLK